MNTVRRTTTRKFADFLKLANIIFESIGAVPYDRLKPKRNKSLLINIIFYFHVINLNFHLINHLIYAWWAHQTDEGFAEIFTAITYASVMIKCQLKFKCLWLKKDVLNALMLELENIFPRTLQQQCDYKLEKYYRQCYGMTIALSILYLMLVLYSPLQCFITENILGLSGTRWNLPYSRLLLWNYEDNWSYYLVYVTQVIVCFTACCQQIAGDLLLCSLSIQLIMHFNYLSAVIKEYCIQHATAIHTVGLKNDLKFLKYVVRYHTKLFNLSADLNAIFGVGLLLNFVFSACVLCVLLFLATIGVSVNMQMKFGFYFITAATQVYFICYLGQQLTDASFEIMQAVYHQNWTHSETKYSKMLLLIATRAKQPLLLKATSFVMVSRGTITMIFHISYKLYTVLRMLYTK